MIDRFADKGPNTPSRYDSYYEEMKVIGTHAALRRLWINEGKRRGYELVNA